MDSPIASKRPRHEALLDPVRPHDGLSFEELSSRYNFRLTSDRRRVFARLVCAEIAGRHGRARALDIGCGTGISNDPENGPEYLRAIATRTDEMWGVEPDTGVVPEHGMFTRFQHATLELADLPESYFDVAFSFLVMEHVEDPHRFMAALFRCLKPGGVYLFLTPNGRHYFTRIARALHALRLEEWVLRGIAGAKVEEYHYPVRYRFNLPRQIRRIAADMGFEPPEFAYLEDVGPQPYFPGPTVALFHLLALKRRVIRSKGALLDLVGRIRKPG